MVSNIYRISEVRLCCHRQNPLEQPRKGEIAMFSARKPQEPPAKRGTGSLAAGGAPFELSAAKRQRLELWGEPRRREEASDGVLVQTPECVVTRVRSVPAALVDEIRRERPGARQVVHCRVAVPSSAAPSRGERQVLSYYVVALRHRLVLWQEGSGHVVTLSLPDEFSPDEPVHPFLFVLYGAHVSLMIVSRSGRVLFWEDVELPYESVPLSVQIPLQHHEKVFTNAHASLTVSSSKDSLFVSNATTPDHQLKSILCWSSLGSVWEVAMEDRRIRVRSLERQQGGFLSGLTKTVSQFFFASASSVSSSEIDPLTPIRAVKIVPTASGVDERDTDDDVRVDKLLLFSNGTIERRSFNSANALDCTTSTEWHFDANKVAITYFSESFPDYHLAKVFVVSIPYILDTSTFGLVVAYVCTARSEETPRVKYALFQLKVISSSRGDVPEPEWAVFLDYEPVFIEGVESSEFFDVETVPINNSAFYLVWIHSQPVHFAAIHLPALPTQTNVRSSGFSLQGVERNTALGFAPRVEVSTEASDAVKGSVSFLLTDNEPLHTDGAGVVCAATASNMARVQSKISTVVDSSTRKKRVEDSDGLTPESHALDEGLSVQEYASSLLSHFHEEQGALSGGPLLIAARDVSTVAEAAVAVVFQILDAKASSGLRWGKDTSEHSVSVPSSVNGAIITPKLVRFQLDEKRSRFEGFLLFLQQKCWDVWQFIVSSDELMQYLVDGEEKLHAAVALCKFQGSISSASEDESEPGIKPKLSGQVLLRAIERTVHQRGYEQEQLRLAGYNAFDIFYCEVSKINDLFVGLSMEIQKLASESGEGNSEFLYALLESGYSMQSLLKTPTSTQLQSSGNWMFTRKIRESIADQISRLSAAVGYPAVSSSKAIVATAEEVFEIADQTLKLGTLLLESYRRFIPMTVGEAAEDLRKEADITKRLTLNPLVFVATEYESPVGLSPLTEESSLNWVTQKKTELFGSCVELSEEYSYFEAMVFLAYREDEQNLAMLDYVLGRREKSTATKRLESYCKKIPDFSAFLYRWYGGEATRYPWGFDGESARAQVYSYLLANSATFGPTLQQYLKTHPLLTKYAWVPATASENFELVAELTLKEAVAEKLSLSKRKTMASISKIAALAGPATPLETAREIKRELTVGRIQEVLMELPVDVALGNAPLSPAALVEKSIESLVSISSEDPLRANVFLIAIEALECLPEDIDPVDFNTYCIRTWREAILADSLLWQRLVEENATAINEHKAEELMRDTLLFKAMVRYASRWERRRSVRSAGLTAEMIDDMVAREVHAGASDSVVNIQSGSLFVKTLHLAQAQ